MRRPSHSLDLSQWICIPARPGQASTEHGPAPALHCLIQPHTATIRLQTPDQWNIFYQTIKLQPLDLCPA